MAEAHQVEGGLGGTPCAGWWGTAEGFGAWSSVAQLPVGSTGPKDRPHPEAGEKSKFFLQKC